MGSRDDREMGYSMSHVAIPHIIHFILYSKNLNRISCVLT